MSNKSKQIETASTNDVHLSDELASLELDLKTANKKAKWDVGGERFASYVAILATSIAIIACDFLSALETSATESYWQGGEQLTSLDTDIVVQQMIGVTMLFIGIRALLSGLLEIVTSIIFDMKVFQKLKTQANRSWNSSIIFFNNLNSTKG